MYFSVPLWIEIRNATSKKQIIRNVSIKLYSKGEYIDDMTQVTNSEKGNEEFYYGNKVAYSFFMQDNGINRFNLQYISNLKDFERMLMRLGYHFMIVRIIARSSVY